DRYERGLTAHREPHVAVAQLRVDVVTKAQHAGPLVFGVGLRYARFLDDARDAHRVLEHGLAWVERAGDGSCERRLRTACERKVSLAREKPRRRVEPDPTCARDVDLAPRVQVAKIRGRSCGAFER